MLTERKIRVLGVIPARYKSERLPGKPLRMIGNKPMIQRTYESALTSGLINDLVVLTDNSEIFDAVSSFGGKVAMTPENLKSGTDRAAYFVSSHSEYDVVVNIQGDEPFIKGEMIDRSIIPFINDNSIDVVTLATEFKNLNDINNPAFVKVVFSANKFALYFSRSPIPFYRNEILPKTYYKHIGLYTYRRKALVEISNLPVSQLEEIEKLEQLRMLENRYDIKVEVVDYEPISVDTEEDLNKANDYLNSF